MPSRTVFLERSSREYICKSCILTLRRNIQPAPPRWGIRSSSRIPYRAQAQPAAQSRKVPQPIDNDERSNTLRKLGLLKDDKGEEQVQVNYFEQGRGGRLRRLKDADEFTTSLTGQGGSLDQQMGELEKEYAEGQESLNEFKQLLAHEPAQDELSKDALNQQLDLDDLKRTRRLGTSVIDALDDLSQEVDKSASDTILITVAGPGWKKGQKDRIVRLNNNLQLAARQLDRGKVNAMGFELWKWYSAARRDLRTNYGAVPPAAWEVLWDVFSIESPQNPNRMNRIHNLAKDMVEAGIKLAPRRQLMAIEAMFVEGWHKEALENHRKRVTTLGADPDTFLEFWELGLRMYCQTGDLIRAERLVDVLFDSPYQHDPRILFPLIRAYAQKTETSDKAYEMYERVRAELHSSMTIEDYDEIISYFLAANQTEKALWIFVEMMTAGRVRLRQMNKLPPSVANPFFAGKWLKRLIGNGDYEGALNVLLLMKEKGVTPRPIQVNGLIGAWLRSGTAENLEHAETTAWSMINTRIQFARGRAQLRESLSDTVVGSIAITQVGEGWPKATLETFSLLAENYKDRGMHNKVEELWEAFRQAEIGPDSFIINQLLFSSLRSGRGKEVPQLCRLLTKKYRVEPDSHTFMALWQALPVNRLATISPSEEPAAISATRELFAETAGFPHVFKDGGIDPGLARNIMHSFRQLRDTAGMLIAFRVLRQAFKLVDPGSMVLEMLCGTTNLPKAAARPSMRKKLITATQSIEHYLSQRQQELVKAGQLLESQELSPEIKSEEMANYFEMHLEAEIYKLDQSEGLLRSAAREMGVYDQTIDVD